MNRFNYRRLKLTEGVNNSIVFAICEFVMLYNRRLPFVGVSEV